MEDNLKNIIANAISVNKDNLKDPKKLISRFKLAIEKNEMVLKDASQIDSKNNNGIELDLNIINNIFNNLEKENIFYRDVVTSEKSDTLIYGKEILDVGNVVIISDGNPYTFIELFVRNIIVGNTCIFANNGYMYGTNKLLLEIFRTVLVQSNLDSNFVQLYISDTPENILTSFASIDLVICVGDHELQKRVLNNSKNKVIISGYENFDIYVEDETHLDFINKLLMGNYNINLYVKENVNINYDKVVTVSDLDEAIAQINYNGNKYASSIFTSSRENASKFIKEVKSKIVTVNTSPLVERLLDIKEEDLIIEKTVIYPNSFKLDGTRVEEKI